MPEVPPLRSRELRLPCAIPDTPEELLRELGGPCLLRVAGQDASRCRAVATLLHGNEPSGLRALHAWLRRGRAPAVDALLFLGAVEAALAGPGFAHRFLPERRDLNRCFLPPFEGPEGEIAEALLRRLREAGPEALVDVHNNTGHNPPYGVGVRAGATELNLVRMFGDRFIHSDLQLGALIEATQSDFPSVVIECGRAGDPQADAVALSGIEAFLHRPQLQHEQPAEAMEILVDPIRVCITPGTRIAFGEQPVPGADLTVPGDVDRHNFERLPPGVRIGWLAEAGSWPLLALGPEGKDLSRELFTIREGVVETRQSIVPIMMTTDRVVAAADCLFYVVRPEPDLTQVA